MPSAFSPTISFLYFPPPADTSAFAPTDGFLYFPPPADTSAFAPTDGFLYFPPPADTSAFAPTIAFVNNSPLTLIRNNNFQPGGLSLGGNLNPASNVDGFSPVIAYFNGSLALNWSGAVNKVLATISIDATTPGTTVIYTVPSGVNLNVSNIFVRCLTANTVTNAVTVSAGSAGPADLFPATQLTGLLNVNDAGTYH